MSELVACDAPGCLGMGPPAWSPDGTRLAFWSDRNNANGLWAVGAGGGSPTLLRNDLSVLGSPAWSPSGEEIAVVGHDRSTDEIGIHVLAATTGQTLRTIRGDAIEFIEGVSWSPDGGYLLVAAVGEGGTPDGSGIYLVRPDGSGLERIIPSGRGPDSYPVWSPDSTQVVFVRSRDRTGSDGLTGDLYRFDLDTRQLQPLTGGPGNDCCPSWQRFQEAQGE